MHKIKQLLCFFLLLESIFIDKKTKKRIKSDFQQWCVYFEKRVTLSSFVNFFVSLPEFRSVVYYRLKNRFRIIPSVFFKGQSSCFICSSSVGDGLILVHGFSTIVHCRSIGKNCTIFQQVTVGYSKGGTPVIGDNCVICCGAKVLGNIIIGNNVVIGANSVVITDIPDNSVVAGIPARIIRTTDSGIAPIDYI